MDTCLILSRAEQFSHHGSGKAWLWFFYWILETLTSVHFKDPFAPSHGSIDVLESWEPLCGSCLYVICKLNFFFFLMHFNPKYLVHCQRLSSADWRARKGVRDDWWAQNHGWRKVHELNQSLDKGRKMLQIAQESQYDLQIECKG